MMYACLCVAYAWHVQHVDVMWCGDAWYPLRSPAAITSSRSRSRTIGSAAIHSGILQSL